MRHVDVQLAEEGGDAARIGRLVVGFRLSLGILWINYSRCALLQLIMELKTDIAVLALIPHLIDRVMIHQFASRFLEVFHFCYKMAYYFVFEDVGELRDVLLELSVDLFLVHLYLPACKHREELKR